MNTWQDKLLVALVGSVIALTWLVKLLVKAVQKLQEVA